MFKETKRKDYTMSELNASDNRRKKKTLLLILLPALAILFSAGVIAAYFSDYFQDTGNISTDTLNIDVTHAVYLNEVETQLTDITNLNPGDVIVIKGTVTNTGSQSAWVRETIRFTPDDSVLLPYFEIYDTEIAQSALLAGTDFSANRLVFANGFAASDNKVIDGAGEDFQTGSGGGFQYIGDSQYNFALTVYFSTAAGNDAQNKTVGFEFTAQALQFVNNNTAEPTEVAWAAVALG